MSSFINTLSFIKSKHFSKFISTILFSFFISSSINGIGRKNYLNQIQISIYLDIYSKFYLVHLSSRICVYQHTASITPIGKYNILFLFANTFLSYTTMYTCVYYITLTHKFLFNIKYKIDLFNVDINAPATNYVT